MSVLWSPADARLRVGPVLGERRSGPISAAVIVLMRAGVVGSVAHERRVRSPLVPPEIFRVRSLNVASLGAAANSAFFAGVAFACAGLLVALMTRS